MAPSHTAAARRLRAVTVVALVVLLTGCGSATSAHSSAGFPTHRTKASAGPAPEVTRTPGHLTTVLGSVVRWTTTDTAYRVVLAVARVGTDGSVLVLPGGATATYLIPKPLVAQGSMLSGLIRVTTEGHRVTAVAIMG